MKTWFIFKVREKNIGVWANNIEEAKNKFMKIYNNVETIYVGNHCYNFDIKIDKKLY